MRQCSSQRGQFAPFAVIAALFWTSAIASKLLVLSFRSFHEHVRRTVMKTIVGGLAPRGGAVVAGWLSWSQAALTRRVADATFGSPRCATKATTRSTARRHAGIARWQMSAPTMWAAPRDGDLLAGALSGAHPLLELAGPLEPSRLFGFAAANAAYRTSNPKPGQRALPSSGSTA